jgi:F-type H+-transporting ATPase subunit a
LEHHLSPWVFVVFSGITISILLVFSILSTRDPQKRPGFLQNLAEMIYEGFENLTIGIVGEHGRKYVPLVGTLFLYILVCNIMGLAPPGIAPTASLNTTIALAVMVFLYVQYESIRANGIGGYLAHFAGIGKVPIFIAPFLFVIEIISELARPVSLSVRLFGNMMGKEQMVLALITMFALPLFKSFYLPIPIQLPILAFGVLVSLVQAFVFALLTAIYLALATEHLAHAHEPHDIHAEVAHTA